MRCPFFLIRSLILFLKLPIEVCRISWCISAHFLRSDVFNTTTLVWATKATVAFSIGHTNKSIEFKSGDAEVHISLLQNLGKWCLYHFWVFIEVWDGAPSCWKVKSWSLNFFISSKDRSKMLLILRYLIPFSTKIRGEF